MRHGNLIYIQGCSFSYTVAAAVPLMARMKKCTSIVCIRHAVLYGPVKRKFPHMLSKYIIFLLCRTTSLPYKFSTASMYSSTIITIAIALAHVDLVPMVCRNPWLLFDLATYSRKIQRNFGNNGKILPHTEGISSDKALQTLHSSHWGFVEAPERA